MRIKGIVISKAKERSEDVIQYRMTKWWAVYLRVELVNNDNKNTEILFKPAAEKNEVCAADALDEQRNDKACPFLPFLSPMSHNTQSPFFMNGSLLFVSSQFNQLDVLSNSQPSSMAEHLKTPKDDNHHYAPDGKHQLSRPREYDQNR